MQQNYIKAGIKKINMAIYQDGSFWETLLNTVVTTISFKRISVITEFTYY